MACWAKSPLPKSELSEVTVWVVESSLVHVTVLFTPMTTVIVAGWKAKPEIETATFPVAWLGATNDVSANARSMLARHAEARHFLLVGSGLVPTRSFRFHNS